MYCMSYSRGLVDDGDETTRSVTDGRHDAVVRVDVLDDRLELLAVGEVKRGPMSSRKKHSGELRGSADELADRSGGLDLGVGDRVGGEAPGVFGEEALGHGARINRWLPSPTSPQGRASITSM